MKVFFTLLALGATVGFVGAAPLKVVTTTAMVGDVVRNVAGDRAAVTTLIGEGVDPHLYKPTRDDVAKMLGADMIFFNGLKLEGRMEDTFKKLEKKGTPVVAVGEAVDKTKLSGGEGHPDPHVWMDPALWAQTVPAVTKALVARDPEGKATYEENATRLLEQLKALDAYVKQAITTIPPERRVLITAHDAFHYLAKSTGITVMSIQGISTESEAGVADINRLVDEVVSRKIPAIFVESSVPDKNVRAVIEGAAARGHTLALGGTLFSDAMGEPGTYTGTYRGMMDHNATTITRALGGEAPAAGMSGQLKP